MSNQDNELKVIVFQLMNKEYAVPVENVQSIEKVMHITRVPGVPSYVKGVINLRGVVTPIIDLRNRFSLEDAAESEHTRIIIITLDGLEVGLIVDSANDVLDLSRESIEPQPQVVGSIETDFISGVAKIDRRLLILLQLDKVLENAA
ncbi:chemotaxis signal transduction protein: modulation of cheA activity in response to attractant [Jeotgalibacillus malaysiensis]|uniref:Chemotaxis signal transduction protein: modulation of cheA activity in response to attractant n=1 Tax=Jeotgalibacillus malaysiensis TaxID=1508404 RepID=A0A0B5AL54_9BACL|nr:chemotaxis signal transduction protein: modulation of cheA activity in response to attractant [Jeotgalibacillus malaysiensis]